MQVTDATWLDALVQAIQSDPDNAAGTAKTLVFTKDTATADQVAQQLIKEGIQ